MKKLLMVACVGFGVSAFTGCGAEVPVAQQVITGLTAVAAGATIYSATCDHAKGAEEVEQTELLRRIESNSREQGREKPYGY